MPRPAGNAKVVYTAEDRGATTTVMRVTKSQRELRIEAFKVQRELDRQGAAFSAIGNILGTTAGKFALFGASAAAAAGAVLAFSRNIGDQAREIENAATGLDLAVTQFTRLRSVFAEGGVEQEDFIDGLRTLSESIQDAATGGQSFIEAFELLGVTFRTSDGALRDRSAVLDDISTALANSSAETRIFAGNVIFGEEAFRRLEPTLLRYGGSLDSISEAAERASGVSTATVEANAEVADAFSSLGNQIDIAAQEIGAFIAPYVIDGLQAVESATRAIAAAFNLIRPPVRRAQDEVEEFFRAANQDIARAPTEQSRRQALERAITQALENRSRLLEREAELEERLAALREQSRRFAFPVHVPEIDVIERSLEGISAALDASLDPINALQERLLNLGSATQDVGDATAAIGDPLDTLQFHWNQIAEDTAQTGVNLEAQGARLQNQFQFLTPLRELEEQRLQTSQDILMSFAAQDAAVAGLTVRVGILNQRIMDQAAALQEEFQFLTPRTELEEQARRAREAMDREARDILFSIGGPPEELERSVSRTRQIASEIFPPVITGLNSAIAASENWQGVLRGVAATATQIGIQLLNTFLRTGSFFPIPGRQFGGPVDPGRPFLVGERGPEIFVPRQAGQIVPNNRLGGVTINFSPTIQGVNEEIVGVVDQRMEFWSGQIGEVAQSAFIVSQGRPSPARRTR